MVRDSRTSAAPRSVVGALAQRRRGRLQLCHGGVDAEQRAFTDALASLHVAYQPIVSVAARTVYGWEALVRTRELTMPRPPALFAVAERLDRVEEVSRAVLAAAPRVLDRAQAGVTLFVNLHARDLFDEALPARLAAEPHAARLVLEVSERASVRDLEACRHRIDALRACGVRIAVDDLGAGYAGLASFAALEPDIVKIDMSLVRDLDVSTTKRRVVGALVSLCRDLGVLVVGEGVETLAESDALAELGCELQQGFYYAVPATPPPEPTWPRPRL